MGVRTAVLASTLLALLVALPAIATATTGDGVRLAGVVFLDLDGDGTHDQDEPGRSGVQVTLRTSATILDAVTTSDDGTWTFNNVQAGDYTVVVEPPIDHRITGGTLPGLDVDSGEANLSVGDTDTEQAGTAGVGSPVTSGPDVATTVTLDEEASTPDAFRWEVTAHNIGPGDADGPVDMRLVLSSEHETTDVTGDWTCEQSAAIVLCEIDADLPAGTSLPSLSLSTAPTGEVGATVSVTATARLDGIFDGAPLNDEDTASATIGGETATTDLDGDGTGDLTDAGAATTGMLVAGLVAVVIGAAAIGATRRTARRP